MKTLNVLAGAILAAALPAAVPAQAAESVKLAWTHYTGWEPWGYIQDHRIAQAKIEQACGAGSMIKIELLNDYAESLNQYTAGAFDGVAATNMDALTVPGVGGRKTTMLVVSDYSDGNDAVISGDPSVTKLADLKGHKLNLEALTVSQYLLARGLEGAGMTEKDLTLVNTSDADMGSFYQSHPKAIVVTWNPIVRSILQADKDAHVLFTSKQIPGEIIDAMVVRSDLAPCAQNAIRDAWFETVAKLKTGDAAMIADLASQAGGSVEDFKAQVETTHFLWTPADADAFTASAKLATTMKYVRDFSFEHGMFGQQKASNSVGVRFPDGQVLGDGSNVVIDYVPQAGVRK